MGKTHFPPPESPKKSKQRPPQSHPPKPNTQPPRYAPGKHRVQANPQTHSNSRPSTPPNSKNNFNSNRIPDHQRPPNHSYVWPQSSNRSFTVGDVAKDLPVKYDPRDPSFSDDRRNPVELRPRVPEKFYSSGGESFAEVIKKPVPVYSQVEHYSRDVGEWEEQLHANRINGNPHDYAKSSRSTVNSIGTASTAQQQIVNQNLYRNPNYFAPPNSFANAYEDKQLDESILIPNLNLDQEVNQFDQTNLSVMVRTDEAPIVQKIPQTDNIWGSGSFVEVLKKPAQIKPPIEAPMDPQLFEGQRRPHTGGIGKPSINSAKNSTAINGTGRYEQNQNGNQNKKRYDQRENSKATRGRETTVVKKPNRKEHHSRGEESVRDAAKKKIRTPEIQVRSSLEQVENPPRTFSDLPDYAFAGSGNSSTFMIGSNGGYWNTADRKTESVDEVNAPVGNTTTFADGIFHRRSFVDVVKRGGEIRINGGEW